MEASYDSATHVTYTGLVNFTNGNPGTAASGNCLVNSLLYDESSPLQVRKGHPGFSPRLLQPPLEEQAGCRFAGPPRVFPRPLQAPWVGGATWLLYQRKRCSQARSPAASCCMGSQTISLQARSNERGIAGAHMSSNSTVVLRGFRPLPTWAVAAWCTGLLRRVNAHAVP